MTTPSVFSVLNKATGQKSLIKADTKGQASRYLVSNFEIEKATAFDVTEIMLAGGTVSDATVMPVEAVASENGGSSDAPTEVANEAVAQVVTDAGPAPSESQASSEPVQ